MGTPANLTDKARAKGLAVRRRNAAANANLRRASLVINSLRKGGLSLRQIAEQLNESGFKTSRGCEFAAESVRRCAKEEKPAPSNN